MMKQYFSAFLIVVFLTSQNYALATTAKVSGHAVQLGLMVNSPEALLKWSDEISTSIDQNSELLQSIDQAEKMEDRNSSRSKRQERITRQIQSRMEMIHQEIKDLQKDELKSLVQNAQAALGAENEETPTQEKILNAFSRTDSDFAPALAKMIVDAGGKIPFVLKLKKKLKESRQALAKQIDKKEAGRSIATIKQVLFAILGTIMILVAAFGILIGAMAGSWPLILGSLAFVAVVGYPIYLLDDDR